MAKHLIVVSDIYGESTTVYESSRKPSYRELYDLANERTTMGVGHFSDSKLIHHLVCDEGKIISTKKDFYQVLRGD